jgi:hypothetical protein
MQGYLEDAHLGITHGPRLNNSADPVRTWKTIRLPASNYAISQFETYTQRWDRTS